MASPISNPADVVNAALVRLGKPGNVGNLFDGSDVAAAALAVYGQTRDELLCTQDWDFAERNVQMVLIKTAPANGYFPPTVWNPANNPPLPWNYEYQYPSDCLKVRTIKAAPLMIPNFDPKPVLFDEANDTAFNPPQKVILCNVANAILVYTGRVTDPTTWRPGFSEAMIAAMARRLAVGLGGLELLKAEAGEEASALAIGSGERG